MRLNSTDVGQIVAKFDFLGTSKSRKGRDIRALSPINPASDVAINNFSLIKKSFLSVSVDKVVFTIWGSYPNLYDIHINREVLFRKIYEEYKNTMLYACGMKTEVPTIEEFYKDLLSDVDSDGVFKPHVEFWMIAQDTHQDETNPDFGAIETKHNGQPIFINKLLAEDIEAIIAHGPVGKQDRAEQNSNKKGKLKAA